eukprot:SAG11_NODE_11518_length_755_cov_2.448478_1_plen_25_part_10
MSQIFDLEKKKSTPSYKFRDSSKTG